MQWASENLQDNNFYSSCDDDMTVNMSELQENIDHNIKKQYLSNWPEFPIICGYQYWNDTVTYPDRNRKNKNFVSKEKYPWTEWPHFCLGGMYSTSVRVIRQLFEISRTQSFLNTDDVWITGILRNILGMPRSMLVKPDRAIAIHNLFFEKQLTEMIVNIFVNKWRKNSGQQFTKKIVCKC